MIHELAKIVGICADSVKAVIHDELNFSKIKSHLAPKLLYIEQKEIQVQISPQLQDHFGGAGDLFPHSVVTCSEAWVHYFTSQTKRASMEW
jgi:hypothetical protein